MLWLSLLASFVFARTVMRRGSISGVSLDMRDDAKMF
jgi:hypothetical protein